MTGRMAKIEAGERVAALLVIALLAVLFLAPIVGTAVFLAPFLEAGQISRGQMAAAVVVVTVFALLLVGTYARRTR